MELPEIITRLPEVDFPLPSTIVKSRALKGDQGLLVFFEAVQDLEVPPHSHKAQWGTVIDGQIELTIGGETRTYGRGDSYNIPAGVVHSGRIPAGAKVIDFFEEADRYRLK